MDLKTNTLAILFLEDIFLGKIRCLRLRRSDFCKDRRDKIEVPDPLVVEDLLSDKLNNRRKLARLITQYRDICIR